MRLKSIGPLTVLVVEAAAGPVASSLREAGLEVWASASGAEALQHATEQPAAIVLGEQETELSAAELCRRLKADPATAPLPVVWRTERTDAANVSEVRLAVTASLDELRGAVHAVVCLRSAATQQAQREAEMRHRSEQLIETNRRKDEFLAQLGHELRNPLAPLLNALHLMRLRAGDAEAVQSARDLAERQVRQLARLVDDLLDASRVSLGKIRLRKELLDVDRIVGEAVDMARPLIEARRHQLTVLAPRDERLRLEGDPMRLVQVLTNLLTNAAKYTEPEGHIWLTTERDDGDILLSVRDTGVGLSAEMLPRVFELFVQAEHGTQEGLGIGLSLVRGLVELHGGTVLALSEGPGEGSEFVVRLPAAPATHLPAALGLPAATTAAAIGPSLRVLIVDDDIDGAESLGLLLRLWKHEVQVAHDGQSALQRAHLWRPEVVLLDIGLPGGLDGFQVAHRLREELGLHQAILLAMTGWGQEEDRRQSRAAGFDHHLVKPVDPAELQTLLARVGALGHETDA
jgi:signal transduction histidine kinase/ActR/RegA family two-component response regulator